MKAQLLVDGPQQRTFALVFHPGDDAVDGLLAFAREHAITAASFSAIGAFAQVTLGYFELEARTYRRIEVREQVEVLSLLGNIARAEEGLKVHAHVVVGRGDGTALGGHLLDSRVQPTLEVVLTESPAHLRRRVDKATGLPLLDLS